MRRGSVELEIVSCACINGSEFSACKMRHGSSRCVYGTTINGVMVAFNIIFFLFFSFARSFARSPLFLFFVLFRFSMCIAAFGVFDFLQKERSGYVRAGRMHKIGYNAGGRWCCFCHSSAATFAAFHTPHFYLTAHTPCSLSSLSTSLLGWLYDGNGLIYRDY